jgi:hypothetical protein
MKTDDTRYAANDNHGDSRHGLPQAMLDLASLLAEAYVARLPLAVNDNRAAVLEA